jgi:hypothetical protein
MYGCLFALGYGIVPALLLLLGLTLSCREAAAE